MEQEAADAVRRKMAVAEDSSAEGARQLDDGGTVAANAVDEPACGDAGGANSCPDGARCGAEGHATTTAQTDFCFSNFPKVSAARPSRKLLELQTLTYIMDMQSSLGRRSAFSFSHTSYPPS